MPAPGQEAYPLSILDDVTRSILETPPLTARSLTRSVMTTQLEEVPKSRLRPEAGELLSLTTGVMAHPALTPAMLEKMKAIAPNVPAHTLRALATVVLTSLDAMSIRPK